ncbi:gamma-glutamyltransferase 2 [Thermodesulfobium acidiphilum]|uniref:Gamma-glutamyltransferase 2 n=1 Tax=Thermodesulfobium acidiphilum TaxID=1794699 RepID=A0A2R4VY18_THEAF|nr:gamma-glutamyltransferase family protein [Thermodesulfobium acidiphilum]AWB09439.1 gamma-glutamyltransferase 2 [Thermodesulfobium acidiphilum]PMP85459.1 MAG: gamma-glutamyltransferase [Thermodesulfobium narugense]
MFDFQRYPYSSERHVCFAKNGMVLTTQPLASQAGLTALQKGGNAVDAALATAVALTVVEPTSCGIGGDCFAIVWKDSKLYALNSSGFAPSNINLDLLIKKGFKKMPRFGFEPITVPGVVWGWKELSSKFGKLKLSEVFAPAIDLALYGYPVSATISRLWENFYNAISLQRGDEFKYWFENFAKDGPPKPASIFKNQSLAKTLEELALTNCKSFYDGRIAEKIVSFFKKYNGYITENDLRDFKGEWVEPLKLNYCGYDIVEMPPNSQGIVVLMALNILKHFDISRNSLYFHRCIESIKLSFEEALSSVGDIKGMEKNVSELFNEEYGLSKARTISDEAYLPKIQSTYCGNTVYLCTADKDGNMVSYIQSNYMGFGSGIVIEDTAIAMHNRGSNFVLERKHPNCIAPKKRPYHTIIPGFILKDNNAIGPFGVMGAFMQPQGHVQVLVNMINFLDNPQAALDAPRFQWLGGKKVLFENKIDKIIVDDLARRGHDVEVTSDSINFGRGQIIIKLDNNVFAGGSEPRADGYPACY